MELKSKQLYASIYHKTSLCPTAFENWPWKASCTPGSCVPVHAWQRGSHSGPSGQVFPASASGSSSCHKPKEKERRFIHHDRVETKGQTVQSRWTLTGNSYMWNNVCLSRLRCNLFYFLPSLPSIYNILLFCFPGVTSSCFWNIQDASCYVTEKEKDTDRVNHNQQAPYQRPHNYQKSQRWDCWGISSQCVTLAEKQQTGGGLERSLECLSPM